MTTSDHGRGRPRRRETDQRIMDAALALIRDKGPTALNIDAVATRSGVARTTIYRRYRDRRELISGALDEVLEASFPAPDLPIGEKLRWILGQVQELLEHGVGRGGTGAVLADADPEFTLVLRRRIEERVSVLRTLMESDVEAGRLGPQVDPDALVGLLFGAYLGEVLRHGQPREGWMDGIVDLLAGAVTA